MAAPFSPEHPVATLPGVVDTYEANESAVPWLGFVILWSKSQPDRIGEVGFLPPFEWRYVGRGDVEIEKFVLVERQVPGEEHVPHPRRGLLTGDTVSRRHLRTRATGVTIEMRKVGTTRTLVNGDPCDEAVLKEGDTVLIVGEVLLLVVRRQRLLPRHPMMRDLHPFGEPDAAGIVGESEAVNALRRDLLAAAASDDNVLLLGETGVGKELCARLIHMSSARAGGPFVVHNSASFTSTLIESELFGNVANYPNPGMGARKGLIASAHLGTLFFDEIGDCPLEVQVQLLRALQFGEYIHVGESLPRRADVRFLGATNRDIYDELRFRADFRARFPRIILVPPLRDRREDIPLILRHLMHLRAKRDTTRALERFFVPGASGKLEPRFGGSLVDYIVRQPLLLNVRELDSFLGKAIDASPGNKVRLPDALRAKGLDNTTVPPPPPAARPAPAPPLSQQRHSAAKEEGRVEAGAPGDPSREQVLAALRQEAGSATRAAKRLGVKRVALYPLMEKYGIKRDDSQE
jgi:two-component system, NtrC family, response regulator HydG